MNEQNEKVRSDPDTEQALTGPETPVDSSYQETEEIEGWALQWDTSALRRANLARKMRNLRRTSSNR